MALMRVDFPTPELPETVKDGTVAQRMGFNTIDEIGMERIKRAVARIKAETGADIDYGFKHYTLKEPSDRTLEKLELFDPSVEFFGENKTNRSRSAARTHREDRSAGARVFSGSESERPASEVRCR